MEKKMAWGNPRYRYNTGKTIARVDDPTIPQRLQVLIDNVNITSSDKDFCESLKGGWDKWKSLTAGQYNFMQKVELRYDENANAANAKLNKEWIDSFTPEMRHRLNTCAKYYRETPYFRDIAERVITNPSWIPSEKQYNAMCKNKYAERLMENAAVAPQYEIGSLVQVRQNSAMYRNMIGMIVHNGESVGPSRGSRVCKVLPIGNDEIVHLHERDLKKYREKKKS